MVEEKGEKRHLPRPQMSITRPSVLLLTKGTVVANKTGPTPIADFRAVFTAKRPYLFLGHETTYAVEQ